MAGLLSQFIDPSRVLLQIRSSRRTAALNEVAKQLEGHPDVLNFQGFYNELLARERLDTTCLGNEIALPHARTEHVQQIVIAVGRSETGVTFENGNQTVRLMFVIGTPKSNPGSYLQVVSSLCRIFKDSTTREALVQAPNAEAFVRILLEAEETLSAAKA